MIPDPIQLMESRIDRHLEAYEEGVCMACGKRVGEENLTCPSPTGDGPAICFDCAGPGADDWSLP